jgi:hypothetical protein
VLLEPNIQVFEKKPKEAKPTEWVLLGLMTC